jgi:hypothetical protein
VSFGPKLDDMPVVPSGGEITATLIVTPSDADFEQEATIYVEEAAGIRLLKIKAKSAPQEPAS